MILFKRINIKNIKQINIYIYKMLFRSINGELIEINKYDFKNDKLYYQKIIEIKKHFTKINNNNNFELNHYSNYLIKLLKNND